MKYLRYFFTLTALMVLILAIWNAFMGTYVFGFFDVWALLAYGSAFVYMNEMKKHEDTK